jgi:DNA-binding NarL/FixJ family response regulator
MKRATVLLADDHPRMRAALRTMLEADYDVIGEAGDGKALVTMGVALRPDVIVLDVGLPILNGLEAGSRLKAQLPEVELVFLTMNRDPDISREAFRIGASGYVHKGEMGEALLPIIQKVLERPGADKG